LRKVQVARTQITNGLLRRQAMELKPVADDGSAGSSAAVGLGQAQIVMQQKHAQDLCKQEAQLKLALVQKKQHLSAHCTRPADGSGQATSYLRLLRSRTMGKRMQARPRSALGHCESTTALPVHLYTRFKKVRTLNGHLAHPVYCLNFDMTGRFIVTGSDDRLIKIWARDSGRLLHTLR
jgi:hypothetical protein